MIVLAREILIFLAVLEFSLSALILMAERTTLKLVIAASAGMLFIIGRFGLQLMNAPNICNSLGYFAGEFPLSPRTLNQSGLFVIYWLLAGSCLLLAGQWLGRQKAAGVPSRRENGPRQGSISVSKEEVSKGGRLKRLSWNWGIGVLLSGLLFAGLHIKKQSMLPRNLDGIMKDVSSIPGFRASPVVDHRGTTLLYAWNADVGVNLSLLDLATLKRTDIDTIKAADCAAPQAFDLFGWSPDDHYMAYCAAIESDIPTRRVFLCDGASGQPKDTFVMEGIVQQAIWLTANSLVLLDSSFGLHLFNINQDGNLGSYGEKGLLPLRAVKNFDKSYALARISDQSVAYIAGGNIWQLDIPSGTATQLTFLTDELPEWLDYNPISSELLVCLTHKDFEKDRFLFRVNALDSKKDGPIRLTSNYTFKGRWIQKGTGIAYVGTQGNANYLCLETKDAALRTNVFAGGHIRSYNIAPNGDKLYAVASIGCEPLSIWEYDIVHKSLRNVVPGLTHPLAVAKVIDPVEVSYTDPVGARKSYFYLPPVGMEAQKKYPVIIDRPSDSRFDPASQILANAGIFYVSINHFGLASSEMLATASGDMLSVREELLKNPSIDPHRIYLAARSASTENAVELGEINPGMWRGVILLSPIKLPTISSKTTQFPSVFISIGDKELVGDREKCEVFVEAACRSLISAQIVLHHSAGHWFEGNKLAEERYRAVATFVLTDY